MMERTGNWRLKRIDMTNLDFYQYPRGNNDGGRLGTDLCPTVTINSWQQNVFLIEEYE